MVDLRLWSQGLGSVDRFNKRRETVMPFRLKMVKSRGGNAVAVEHLDAQAGNKGC